MTTEPIRVELPHGLVALLYLREWSPALRPPDPVDAYLDTNPPTDDEDRPW